MGDLQAQPDLVFAGECTAYALFPDRIDPIVNDMVLALFHGLMGRAIAGIIELVPSYRALMIAYDPLVIDDDDLARIVADTAAAPPPRPSRRRTITLPVAYGGEHGPDLEAVARQANLPAGEVVRRHAGALYDVFFLGFTPGFPFLGGMPAELATPRRATPRPRVAAGSVGIAGSQTGVYPLPSPGGWNLIGRTPEALFDPRHDVGDAVLLRPGDRVRFRPIPPELFDALAARTDGAPDRRETVA